MQHLAYIAYDDIQTYKQKQQTFQAGYFKIQAGKIKRVPQLPHLRKIRLCSV